MTKLLVHGASGRLGGEIVLAAQRRKVECSGFRCGEPTLAEELARGPLIIIDATKPDGTQKLLATLRTLERKNILGLVIGTTGHTAEQIEAIRQFSGQVPVCLASNFSRGVYLFEEILKAKTASGKTIADLARSLGFSLGGWEIHHDKKLDAPSGTAKTLAQACGLPADSFSAVRVGSVTGEHTLLFSGEAEDLRLTHTAHARALFAAGAVALSLAMASQKLAPGWYEKGQFFRD